MILFVLTDMSKQEFVIHQKINLMLGSSFGYIYIHTVVLFGMEIKWETLCPDCSKMHFYNIKIKTSEIIRKTRHLFHWRFKVQLTFTNITLKVYHYNTLRSFKNIRSEICPSTSSKHQSYQFTSNYRCNVYGHLS